MSSPKGYTSQEKDDRLKPQFATVEPVRTLQNGLSVLAHSTVYEVGLDAAEAGSTTSVIVATAHAALKGDVIRLTSGALSGREVKVNEVQVNSITLAETLPSAVATGVTFQILRHKYPLVEPTGEMKVTGTFAATFTEEAVVADGGALPAKVKVVGGYDGAAVQVIKTDAAGELQIDVLSSALPSGAATSAAQTDGTQKTKIVDAAGGTITSTTTGPVKALDVNVAVAATSPGNDVFATTITGTRYNQVEVNFETAPGATFITQTFSGGGAVTHTNGHALYSTGTATSAQSKAVSVGSVVYRPANEIYAYFTAAFTTPTSAASYQRIGIYDTNNGFFIGYEGTSFGVTVRSGTADASTARASFNGDTLTGAVGSKFTRNGSPEAINLSLSNLFRIRFGWLGSGSILFDVFSPDGVWVNFHTIKQPNSSLNPSIQNPNIPITLDVRKTASDATNLVMATACWAGGTSSQFTKITDALTDNSLAGLTRAVITGVTTGGGGGYVNVKVNPSGALVADVTGTVAATQSGTWNINNVSGAVSLPTGAATESTLSAVSGKLPATLGQKTMANSLAVVLASDQTSIPVTGSFSAAANTVVDLLDANILDTSSTNIPGSASSPVQVVASLAATVKALQCLDTTGAWVGLYVGAAASEVLKLVIGPGSDQTIEHSIPSGSRVSLKRLDSTTAVSSGIVAINFLG